MTDKQIQDIKQLASDMGRIEPDADQIAVNVYQLHSTIIEPSGNPLLKFLYNLFEAIHRFYLNFFFKTPGNIDSVCPYYERLARAAEMKDNLYTASVMEELRCLS